MPSFIGLNLLLCGVFWEKRLFLITNYELPIAFPHQKIHDPKFPLLEIVLILFFNSNLKKTIRNLSMQHSMSSWGFTNDFISFLGFLGLGLGFSFLRFLGLGLGLNKMDLAYVCMS
jgi:hypothetical protein